MKFTIGRPKPRFAKPLPVIVKLAGGVARSIELGVMPLTPGTGRVSVTVSAALPIRLKGAPLPASCQTPASTWPADSPGRFGVMHVGGVGQCTVSVVRLISVVFVNDTATTEIFTLSLHDALPIWFAKPLPVIVKLAGGVARSIELGVMPLTRVSVTVSAALPIRLKVGALPDIGTASGRARG